MWAMLCHLAGLCGLIFPSFGALVGPLVVWLLKRNEHPAIDAAGKEALNFHLSALLYTWGLILIGFLTLWLLIGFLFLLMASAVAILALVFSVVAAVRTSDGHVYRYPATIRFIG